MQFLKQEFYLDCQVVSDLRGEGKTENQQLLAERFGTLIGLLTNLPPGDVTRQTKTPFHQKQAEISGGLFKQLLY